LNNQFYPNLNHYEYYRNAHTPAYYYDRNQQRFVPFFPLLPLLGGLAGGFALGALAFRPPYYPYYPPYPPYPGYPPYGPYPGYQPDFTNTGPYLPGNTALYPSNNLKPYPY
jgi:hypothetical protein